MGSNGKSTGNINDERLFPICCWLVVSSVLSAVGARSDADTSTWFQVVQEVIELVGVIGGNEYAAQPRPLQGELAVGGPQAIRRYSRACCVPRLRAPRVPPLAALFGVKLLSRQE